jgi:hypothetical protein
MDVYSPMQRRLKNAIITKAAAASRWGFKQLRAIFLIPLPEI